MTNKLSKNLAFTLGEAMVVLVIIAGLAAVALPRFGTVMNNFRNQEATQILLAIYAEQIQFRKDSGGTNYTSDIANLGVDIDGTSDHFNTPVLEANTTITCPSNSAQRYVARMQTIDTTYTLYMLESGNIVCMPCTGSVCIKMGFGEF